MSEAKSLTPAVPQIDHVVETGPALPFWTVFKREFTAYFKSPIAYGIAFAFLFVLGIIFNSYISSGNGQSPANSTVIPSLLSFLLVFFTPLITMRLIAEEAREGTLEVLMTLPMNEFQFIFGKFLAAWGYYTVVLLLTVVYHIILTTLGIPDLGAAFGAYFGAWLLGGALIAVAMIASALTEDQITAAFLGVALMLGLFLADAAAAWVANQGAISGVSNFIRELGLQAHYDYTMVRGILRAEDVVYFLFLIIASLFITTRIVEIRRWRA